jgi:hypothetical protein
MTSLRARASCIASVVALGVAVTIGGCASTPDDASTAKLALGPLATDDYVALVHPVLERRCGSIDCHGALPRGLRVYGQTGLRLPNDVGLVPGGGATTLEEKRATYESIVALQPERTNALLLKEPRTPADAYQLSLLTKATATERHRGGPSLLRGEPAEQCIVTWLVGHADPNLCATGAKGP